MAVTRGSSRWRAEAWGKPCAIDKVTVPIYAGGPKLHCRRELVPAVLQLGAVFLRWHYIVRRVGGYNCRQITGGTTYSSHAYGLSLDVNDDTNPYRLDRLVTDMPALMIADVYLVRTSAGCQVWRWGGDWDGRPDTAHTNYDAMHFECIATPAELAVGFTAYPSVPAFVIAWPVIRRGAQGPAVVELQRLLVLGNTTGVGAFGPRTEAAVILYQQARGLVADGVVGHATWTALLTHMQPLGVDEPRPQKLLSTTAP